MLRFSKHSSWANAIDIRVSIVPILPEDHGVSAALAAQKITIRASCELFVSCNDVESIVHMVGMTVK